jgi:uncharacterized membrane protein
MAGFGSWQLARLTLGERGGRIGLATLTGVLIVVLDLQIETVATLINNYWFWIDGGLYYGVPPQNFAGWWVVGFLIALIIATILPRNGENEFGQYAAVALSAARTYRRVCLASMYPLCSIS